MDSFHFDFTSYEISNYSVDNSHAAYRSLVFASVKKILLSLAVRNVTSRYSRCKLSYRQPQNFEFTSCTFGSNNNLLFNLTLFVGQRDAQSILHRVQGPGDRLHGAADRWHKCRISTYVLAAGSSCPGRPEQPADGAAAHHIVAGRW